MMAATANLKKDRKINMVTMLVLANIHTQRIL